MARLLSKFMLFAGACLALAAPAYAGLDLFGYGELGAGISLSALSTPSHSCLTWGSQQYCGSSDFHDSSTPKDFAGSIHIGTPIYAGLSLQLDLEGKRLFLGTLPSQFNPYQFVSRRVNKYGLGVHLDWTDDDYRVGWIASIGDSDWMSQYNNRLVSAGLEGEWFLDRFTFLSQAIYSHAVSGPFMGRSWTGRGLNSWYLYSGARYFFRDNLMFETDVGAGTVTNGGSWFGGESNGGMLHWSTKAEYRLEEYPVSFVLDYQGSYGTWSRHTAESGDYGPGGPPPGWLVHFSYDDTHTWRRSENLLMLRVRYYIGPDSLIANDRKGAGLSDYNPWYGVEPVTEPFLGDGRFLTPDWPVF